MDSTSCQGSGPALGCSSSQHVGTQWMTRVPMSNTLEAVEFRTLCQLMQQ